MLDYIFLCSILFAFYLRYFSPLIITYLVRDPLAKKPTRAYHKAACFDVYSVEDVTIPPNQWREISLGIAFAPWPQIYFPKLNFTLTPFGKVAFKIHTRSGLAIRKGQRAHLGIIDGDYRGTITIIMFNHNSYPVRYKPGNKIAQLEFFRVPTVLFWKKSKLSSSQRGVKGHGSSGD